MPPHRVDDTMKKPQPAPDAARRSDARKARVLVRISIKERAQLDALAQARQVTVSDLMREALAPMIKKAS